MKRRRLKWRSRVHVHPWDSFKWPDELTVQQSPVKFSHHHHHDLGLEEVDWKRRCLFFSRCLPSVESKKGINPSSISLVIFLESLPILFYFTSIPSMSLPHSVDLKDDASFIHSNSIVHSNHFLFPPCPTLLLDLLLSFQIRNDNNNCFETSSQTKMCSQNSDLCCTKRNSHHHLLLRDIKGRRRISMRPVWRVSSEKIPRKEVG